jgi:hypothetical protein
MENKFWVEQKVWDTTYRVNGGLPVQVIKITNDIAKVWFIKGEEEIETCELISINHLRPCS